MDGMLSQEEINALLGSMEEDGGGDAVATEEAAPDTGGGGDSEGLTSDEADALGEIANISMGTAATTLS
ncbi:MAG: chemotaxis protein CheC, partial [Eubacterium sp.]|nr:chemotaxis protein CheC [Eubacterium sp.]